MTPSLAVSIEFLYIHKKTWSQFCRSFHAVKALALPSMSKRATLKAPRRCVYITSNQLRNKIIV